MNKRPQGWDRIERDIALILMKAGVTGPEIDECIEWAFGRGAWEVPIWPDWKDRWNRIHPGYFQIRQGDKFMHVLFVIGKAFLKYKDHRIILPN